jgi:negative regulator of flagellin synthesis FlgM
MKVSNPNVKSPTVTSSNTQAVDKKSDSKAGAKVSGDLAEAGLSESTKINVSDRAQAMQKAKQIASDDSVDEARIAKFQALIDSGKYKVDAEAIAERLVDEHLLSE